MSYPGNKSHEIDEFLLNRKFNEVMETFLMVRQQSCQGFSCTIHINSPEYPDMPCPSPTDPSTFVFHPRRARVALHNFTFSNVKKSGQRVRRRTSLPNITFCTC
jgi:hypothetical protein